MAPATRHAPGAVGAALAALAVFWVGCADAPDGGAPVERAAWVHLVEGYEPAPVDRPLELAAADGWHASLRSVRGEPWLAVAYDADAFEPTPFEGWWSAPRIAPTAATAAAGQSLLTIGGEALERVAVSEGALDPLGVPPGSWAAVGDRVFVRTAADAGPPTDCAHLVPSPLGRPDGERWRVRVGRFAGDGFLVLPGRPVEFEVASGPARVLSTTPFVAASLPVDEPVLLRVLLDGVPVWSRRLTADAVGEHGWLEHVSVELPPLGAPGALAFEVRGGAALAGFGSPVLGPRSRAPRAALDGRPNLVLFVVDTFRADFLRAGRHLVDAPDEDFELATLEALAASSLRFERAWSTSTSTLPSHASLFASLLPHQHGATHRAGALARGARTVAEVLRDEGYRTVAVTDGVYVTAQTGLAQGFEVFDQVSSTRTLPLDRARAALASGDGRPTFLFVHTYFTHSPFEPSANARARVGLAADAPSEAELYAAASAVALHGGPALDHASHPALSGLRDLYRAEALDLDAELARWLDDFDALGWRDTTHLFLTSDHGESFGDHGQLYHVGDLYEAQTRVPLLWSGPGVRPAPRRDAASGVDLAPTLAALAGAEPDPRWVGRDLARTDPTAAAWSAVERLAGARREQVALTDGDWKVLEGPEPDRRFAFDLTRDPDELAPVPPRSPAWPRPLGERFARGLDAVRGRVLAPPRPRELAPEEVDRLRALGYLGD